MILRGPLLSEHRIALLQMQGQTHARVENAHGNQAHASKSGAIDLKLTANSDIRTDAKRDGLRVIEASNAAAGNSTDESHERALTFEQVVAWLAVQDAATRSACASILANEVTQTHEAAKKDGFESGRKAGEAVAARDATLQLEALRDMAAAAEKAFIEEQTQMQNICVEIVAEALTKIAGPLLASEAAVTGMVREVLARVKEGREIVVRVAREDLPALRKCENELAGALSGRKLELLADSRIELGGCIVETKLGSLDGRLEVQLRELYETLRLAKSSSPEIA
jgi:flagellar assembly protein FliH